MAQLAQDFEPVNARQSQIENHQIVGLRDQHVIRGQAVNRQVDSESHRAERARKAVGQKRVVLDDEQAHQMDR